MANRYWVGGAGTWNTSNTANWSASSGGASGASAPTSSDSVYFDSNSGSGAVTFGNGNCLDCNISSGTPVTFAATTNGIFVYGNWTNLTYLNMGTGSFVIFSSTTSVNISQPYATFYNINLNGAGGTFNLAGNIVVSNQLSLTRGTLAPGGNQLSVDYFYAPGTYACGITYTGSTPKIRLTGSNRTVAVYNYPNCTLTGDVVFLLYGAPTTGTRTIQASASSAGVGALSFWVDGGSDTVALVAVLSSTNRVNAFITTAGTFSGTVSVSNNTEVFGNFALSASNTWTNGSSYQLKMKGTTSVNFNSNGVALGSTPVYFDGVGGTFTLYGDLVTSTTVYLVNGTLSTNAQYITSSSFSSTGTGTRSLIADYTTWTLTGYGYPWTISGSNITANLDTCALNFSSSTSTKTLSTLSSITYGEVVNTGANVLILEPATYAVVNATGLGLNSPIRFTSGATTYVNYIGSGTGPFPNQIVLTSTTTGSQATLSKASGTINLSYADLKDLNATGGATWLAYTSNGNTNSGNNTGWIFSASSGNFMAFF